MTELTTGLMRRCVNCEEKGWEGCMDCTDGLVFSDEGLAFVHRLIEYVRHEMSGTTWRMER